MIISKKLRDNLISGTALVGTIASLYYLTRREVSAEYPTADGSTRSYSAVRDVFGCDVQMQQLTPQGGLKRQDISVGDKSISMQETVSDFNVRNYEVLRNGTMTRDGQKLGVEDQAERKRVNADTGTAFRVCDSLTYEFIFRDVLGLPNPPTPGRSGIVAPKENTL